MKVFIPQLGTKLILTADWSFDLPNDHQNNGIMKLLKKPFDDVAVITGCSLPAGTELIVRTIDVRLGQNGYEKIAFSAKIGKAPSTRFFVRGADANKIEADVFVMGVEQVEPVPNDPAVAAIEFALALNDGTGRDFLHAWNHGAFDVIRIEWPEAPETVYIGADPLYKPKVAT